MIDIRLDHVDYGYPDGTVALAGVDLAIGGGACVALIGANGSGKTTLARLLVGLLRPTAGSVLVGGSDLAALHVAQAATMVGLSFQDPGRQIFGRTVRAEVEFGPRNLGRSSNARDAAVERALDAVGLADAVDVHPQDLGDAHRKLLSVASVLAMETPIVVLDEPTTGLDASGSARIEAIITDLRDAGHSVIAISHDMRFVAESFERLVLLESGRVSIDAAPLEAFDQRMWTQLRAAGIEPPAAAIEGARLGLASTPTEQHLRDALAALKGRA